MPAKASVPKSPPLRDAKLLIQLHKEDWYFNDDNFEDCYCNINTFDNRCYFNDDNFEKGCYFNGDNEEVATLPSLRRL